MYLFFQIIITINNHIFIFGRPQIAGLEVREKEKKTINNHTYIIYDKTLK